MKFPIDILILDNKNKVVAVKENMKPNSIFLWNTKYNTVIELPAGAITKSKTKIGDVIKFDR